jgi:hypothetical protein
MGIALAPLAPKRSMPIAARAFVGLTLVAGFWAAVAGGIPTRDPRFWYWAATCAVGEMLWLRLPLGRATMSMGSTANFAAVLVLPAPIAISAATLASLCVERASMRKPLLRALFNAAGTALTVGATSLVLKALSPAGAFALHDVRLLLTLALAAAIYYACNRTLVTGVLALDGALPLSLVWRRNFGVNRDLLPSGAALSLGVLLAQLHAHAGPVALAFVTLPALVVFQAHRRLYAATAIKAEARPAATEPPRRAVNE